MSGATMGGAWAVIDRSHNWPIFEIWFDDEEIPIRSYHIRVQKVGASSPPSPYFFENPPE